MWVSEEERNQYLARVRAEDATETEEVLKARQFKDLRTSVKLLNNMIVTGDLDDAYQSGILTREEKSKVPNEHYELQYDGKEALDFIQDVERAYERVVEKRNIIVDNTGIRLMFQYLYRHIQLTLEKGDLVHISDDRVTLFRNDVAVYADHENI